MESKTFLAEMPWSALARALWIDAHASKMTVLEAAELCRKCHRFAPFLFLNGNTFANVAKVALESALWTLPAAEVAIYRTAIGHYVAGTIGLHELPPLLRADQ